MSASSRRQKANQQNAQRSTGPRTAAGKARASRNAVRHGLSMAVTGEEVEAEIERLAAMFQQGCAGPGVRDQARLAAEATFELRRIRQVRQLILHHYACCIEAARSLVAISEDPDENTETVQDQVLLAELAPLERYITRALSRRRSALRRLEAALTSTPAAPTRAGVVVQQ